MYMSLDSEARLQKIITSPPSPPLSSPSDGPSTPEAEALHFSLPATPPRKESTSLSKLEFQTPSPPKNLPDLPDPPSSISSENEDLAPSYQNLTSLKTPRPPGAWTMTPVPSRSNPLVRSNSLPTDDEHESGLATPAASLSRAATMPPQTPALPGGWLATPGSKKSVRFYEEPSLDSEKSDIQQATAILEDITPNETAAFSEGPQLSKSSNISDGRSNGSLKSSRARSPRKAATIRMVDAFGREENNKEVNLKTSSIRIVDAMGRTVEDSLDSVPSVQDGPPLTRIDVVERVRNGLQELQKELNEEER
ncbi:hypothetical protein GYMLUDRAFT_621726 [Collybiopsis luxurians FD-317 M1]|nr:hypothetical protein GYMLUDRAFT_621726 [Collybiopsis luxurians FD-317 M1]